MVKPYLSAFVMVRVLLLLCLLIAENTFAFPLKNRAFTQQQNKVEHLITQFKMEEAIVASSSLSSPYNEFYQINVSFYQFVATQDPTHKTTFMNQWNMVLATIEIMPDNEPHKNVLLSEIHAKRAVIDFLAQDYVTAAWHIRAANQYIQTNKKSFPDSPTNLKMSGVFNVVFSNVPKEYQWFMNMLGFKGNFESGYKQLKRAVSEGDILESEASIILYFTEKNLVSKPKEAIERLNFEQKRIGKCMILELFTASGYLGMNENEKAIGILRNRKQYAESDEVFFTPYWDYLLGKAYFYKENYTAAIKSFDQFNEKIKGELYIGDALFKTGMSYLLNGDYPTAKNYFIQLQNQKNSGFDEDEYALTTSKRFIKSPPSTHTKQLFRARNRYDGGYFTESILILDKLKAEITNLSRENKVEMYYRYGRVYQQADFPNAAKTAYLASLNETSPGNSLYMQPYACYYLGEMYKKEGNNEEARKYYKKALTYNDYLYQNGLESKCKVALSRL